MNLNFKRTEYCPACKSRDKHKKLIALSQFSVFRCRCGHRFIDPALDAQSQIEIYQSSETLEAINPALKNYYEYQKLTPGSRTYREYSEALVLLKQHSKGRMLLEAACGSGDFLRLAKKEGWQAVGLDTSSENVASLRRDGVEAVCEDYLRYQNHGNFDVVALWDFIEHTQTPEKFLQKAHALLKTDGLLLLAVPRYPNLLSVLSEIFYSLSLGRVRGPAEKLYILEHTSYFNEKTLSHLLSENRFVPVAEKRSESDLNRYAFAPLTRQMLRLAFVCARFIRLENRLLLIARKKAD